LARIVAQRKILAVVMMIEGETEEVELEVMPVEEAVADVVMVMALAAVKK